ncbi:hypothetical protein AX27061_1389 [Achromobacter xylosoxidans NBRC 15126 = ATCC 27061]|nr:hypothetical protein AX27061_1389 [Achromobacter xylosoxidans NBRC 15126 = ATCC 27061]
MAYACQRCRRLPFSWRNGITPRHSRVTASDFRARPELDQLSNTESQPVINRNACHSCSGG